MDMVRWGSEFYGGDLGPKSQEMIIGTVFRNPVPEFMTAAIGGIPVEQRSSRRWNQWIALFASSAVFGAVAMVGVLLAHKADAGSNNGLVTLPIVGVSIALAALASSNTFDVVRLLQKRFSS